MVGDKEMKKIIVAFFFFLIFSLLMTWPLASKAYDYLPGNGDNFTGTFIINYNIRKLVSLNFVNYFDAPFFYPLKNTLAFSEHLFIQSLLGIPVFILTHNPVFTYNFVLLLSFLMSGFFMFMFVFYLTGSWFGSLVAGFVYSFLPFRLGETRITILSVQFFPLVFLYFEKFLKSKSWRNFSVFSVAFLMQAFSSWYYLVILIVSLASFITVRIILMRKRLLLKPTKKFFLMIILFFSVFFIFLYFLGKPYFEVQKKYNIIEGKLGVSIERSFTDSASLVSFLITGPRNILYGKNWEGFLKIHEQERRKEENVARDKGELPRIKRIKYLFPGLSAIFLSGVGLFALRDRKWKQRKMFSALLFTALICFVFSLGPYFFWGERKVLLPYFWLRQLPGVAALRSTGRFIIPCLMVLALLVGMGIKQLWKKDLLSRFITVILFIMLIGEYSSYPPDFVNIKDDKFYKNEVYRVLSQEKEDFVILEFPIKQYWCYLLPATIHNKKLVYGYAGFRPKNYGEKMTIISVEFPNEEAVKLLKGFDVKYIVVHVEEIEEEKKEQLLQDIKISEDFEIVESYPDTLLVELLTND